VLQLRKILEPETAALAAQNISKVQLEELNCILKEQSLAKDSSIAISLDKKFHYKIAEASNNPLITTINFSISSLIESYIEASEVYTLNKDMIKGQHEEIYNALLFHDSLKASNAVRKHLELSNYM
jgi:DNA-binding FadR family transcriptional regulator